MMKKDLLLLHGALGASVQFKELVALLEHDFHCHLLDFPGHGFGENTEEMSIGSCVDALRIKIQQLGLSKPLVFGYSMGGYVALRAEALHPGSFEAIVTLGTKFNWSPEIAERETAMLNPVKIAEKLPQFAAYLDNVQQPRDWKQVMSDTQGLMRRLGDQPLMTPEVLQKIRIPVTLTLGEKDTMVTPEETRKVQEHILNARFEILPDVPHPIQLIDPRVIRDLLFATLLNR